jgi:LDH2 family malate/lactate/ureidoglycolate dehydrogenase
MYPVNFLYEFTQNLFSKTGCSQTDSVTIADVLIRAELRGIPSHGLLRIPDYIMLFESGRINTTPGLKIVHETPSTAVVNGDRAFGMVAAKYSMEIAIEKARKVGTGWVSTNNSNHFGIAGYYAMMALEHDMIGIVMTNANPLVAPTFSVSKLLGTNPIAVAIPAGAQPPFVADFATTPIARGKLEIFSKKNMKVPFGYVQDKNGYASDNPDILKEGGAMLTLGGDYEHGSHKGYCMSSVVDIFSAVLSGANFGPFVPPSVGYLKVLENSPGLGTGHFFGAMRIDAFQPADVFKKYMDQWIATFRNAKPADGHDKVLIPGDPEREFEKDISENGIQLIPSVEAELIQIANKFNLKFP